MTFNLPLNESSEFKEVNRCGPLTTNHMDDDVELFLVRIPNKMFEPSHLINKEIKLSSKKNCCVKVQNHDIELLLEDANSLNGFLMMSEEENTLLKPVNKKIEKQIMTQYSISLEPPTDFSLEPFRNNFYEPPADLKRRNFFKNENSSSASKMHLIKDKSITKVKERKLKKEKN